MRFFDVIVCAFRVQIIEIEDPFSVVHVRANVDGEQYAYRITKYSGHKLTGDWRERGYIQAYYHAKNEGSTVKFIRTDQPGQRKRSAR